MCVYCFFLRQDWSVFSRLSDVWCRLYHFRIIQGRNLSVKDEALYVITGNQLFVSVICRRKIGWIMVVWFCFKYDAYRYVIISSYFVKGVFFQMCMTMQIFWKSWRLLPAYFSHRNVQMSLNTSNLRTGNHVCLSGIQRF